MPYSDRRVRWREPRRSGARRGRSASLPARLVGLVPGFFAELIADRGRCGGRRAARLPGLLSALTLLTFAWHPLQRLEAGRDKGEKRTDDWPRAGPPRPCACSGGRAGSRRARTHANGRDSRAAGESRGSRSRRRRRRSPSAPRCREPRPGVGGRPARSARRAKAVDAGETELNALQERLEATLSEFKVEGDVAGRTTGPVVTQYGVRLRPGRQDEPAGRAGGRPRAQDERPVHPGGPHPRPRHGGRRSAQSQVARGHAARAAGRRGLEPRRTACCR